MLEGSSGYSKGVLVTGSIKKKEATTYTPGVNNITINKGQYLNGNQVILGDSNLKPENIKSGVEIFGIKGSIKDNSGQTLEMNVGIQDDKYIYLTIPETGYYDTNSVIKIENNNITLTNTTFTVKGIILSGLYEGLGRVIYANIPEQYKKNNLILRMSHIYTYDDIDIVGYSYFFKSGSQATTQINAIEFDEHNIWLGNIWGALEESKYLENAPLKIVFDVFQA